jgi:predicted dehydrogenase
MIHQFTDRFTYPGSLFLDIHGQTRGFPLYMLDSFVESILERVEPLATVEEGYLVTRVVEAVHHSILSGQPIEL